MTEPTFGQWPPQPTPTAGPQVLGTGMLDGSGTLAYESGVVLDSSKQSTGVFVVTLASLVSTDQTTFAFAARAGELDELRVCTYNLVGSEIDPTAELTIYCWDAAGAPADPVQIAITVFGTPVDD